MVGGSAMAEGEGSTITERLYEEPRAHALRDRYLAMFGGPEIPVPVESIAEDFLGLRGRLGSHRVPPCQRYCFASFTN